MYLCIFCCNSVFISSNFFLSSTTVSSFVVFISAIFNSFESILFSKAFTLVCSSVCTTSVMILLIWESNSDSFVLRMPSCFAFGDDVFASNSVLPLLRGVVVCSFVSLSSSVLYFFDNWRVESVGIPLYSSTNCSRWLAILCNWACSYNCNVISVYFVQL